MKKGCIPEYFPKVLNYKFRLTENIEHMQHLMVFILLFELDLHFFPILLHFIVPTFLK